MKNCPYDLRYTCILERPRAYTTKYGLKSFRNYGVKIWNLLPNNCKSAVFLLDIKNMIKSWNGPGCKCSVCSIFLNWSYSVKHDTIYLTVCKLMYACLIILPLYWFLCVILILYKFWCLRRILCHLCYDHIYTCANLFNVLFQCEYHCVG